jgi:hypothetical protein
VSGSERAIDNFTTMKQTFPREWNSGNDCDSRFNHDDVRVCLPEASGGYGFEVIGTNDISEGNGISASPGSKLNAITRDPERSNCVVMHYYANGGGFQTAFGQKVGCNFPAWFNFTLQLVGVLRPVTPTN